MKRRCFLPLLGLSLGAHAAAPALGGESESDAAAVRAKLERALPKTAIASVDCERPGGLCEIAAGDNILYTDREATVLIVGRVFDLATGDDLTAGARRKAFGPDAAAAEVTQTASVDWSSLPKGGAIVRGAGAARRIAVFSDLNCAWCRALHGELATIPDLEVSEHIVSFLASDARARSVACAGDREAALHDAYTNAPLPPAPKDCRPEVLAINTAFFEQQGFQGTPVIVRPDGAVLFGLRDAEFLSRWIEEGQSK